MISIICCCLNERTQTHTFQAWFEYGLMACFGDFAASAFGQAAADQGWLTGMDGGWWWMDPASNATPFVATLLNEAMDLYNITGVQLDDHFACPASLGSSVCSVAVMDDAAMALSDAFTGSRAALALSPAPLDFALRNYNVDWRHWGDLGLFSEFAPQHYTTTASSFELGLADTLAAFQPDRVLAGIRLQGTGANTPWGEVSKMLDYSEKEGVGVSLWFSDGVLNLYQRQLQEYWDIGGGAPSPAPSGDCDQCYSCVKSGGGNGCAPSPCSQSCAGINECVSTPHPSSPRNLQHVLFYAAR
jgi:hypothetical protein